MKKSNYTTSYKVQSSIMCLTYSKIITPQQFSDIENDFWEGGNDIMTNWGTDKLGLEGCTYYLCSKYENGIIFWAFKEEQTKSKRQMRR